MAAFIAPRRLQCVWIIAVGACLIASGIGAQKADVPLESGQLVRRFMF
jgi:hypothetical protein